MAQGQITVRSEYLFPSAPIAELIASATDHIRALAVTFSFQFNGAGANTQITVGVGVPAATGVPYRTWTPQATDPSIGLSNAAVIATLWTTPPTAPTAFLRRFSFVTPGISGDNGLVIERKIIFPRGFMLKSSSSLVAWCISPAPGNFAAAAYADTTFEFDA